MSSKSKSEESSIVVDHIEPDDPVEKLDRIGERRAQKLPWDTVEGLSRTTADELYDGDHIAVSADEAEHIMTQATKAVTGKETSDVEPTEPSEDDDSPSEVAVDDLNPDSGQDIPPMSECDKVGIIVGMANERGSESTLTGIEDERLMSEFAKRLTEADLDVEGDGWTPVLLDSGMGRPEVVRYLQMADSHERVLQTEAKHDRFSSAREAYQDRDDRFVGNDIDGLLVVANGEYVGKFVNMAKRAGIPFDTPALEDDEDDPDGLDVEEA